jgi:quercetin dioxygenase-like cupin family protein
MKLLFLSAVAIAAVLFGGGSVAAQTPSAAAQTPSCSAREYRQFDFWIGEWDVLAPDGTRAGHNRVEQIEGGCGLQENWTGQGGGTGRSINTYSPADKQWHQYWLGSGGGILNLAGAFDGDTLTLRGTSAGASGATVDNRLQFTRHADGTVRQFWQQSRDGGKTWSVAFDGKYVRAQKPAGRQGVVYKAPSGITLRLMLDDTNVGEAVSVGEMTFPPNLDSGDHAHGAIEMFYVLSGELEHVVNGVSQRLTAGMTGWVKPPDRVRHKTGAAGANAVVIWAPGEEAKRITARWTKEP